MGYTHYWEVFRNISDSEWVDIRLDFFKVLPNFFDILDQTGGQKLEVSEENIYLNGIGKDQHETFVLLKTKDSSFCKTARKEYDIAVCSALIILKHYMKSHVDVGSDGDTVSNDEWQPAMQLCQKVLGYGKDFELD